MRSPILVPDAGRITFANDDETTEAFPRHPARRSEELHAKLGGVPFTTVEDVVARMKSVEKWPMGNENAPSGLAENMRRADSSKDILQLWKDEWDSRR